MTKRTVSMTLDTEIIEGAKQLRLNLSGEVNEFLRGLLLRNNEDIDGINIKLERFNLEKALKKHAYYSALVKQIQTKIAKYEDVQTEKAKKKLEDEKEAIESAKKCKNCGITIPEDLKSYEFKIGAICNSCYLKARGEDYKRWNNGG